MNEAQNNYTRQQLIKHIIGGEAFLTIDEMLKKIPFEKVGIKQKGLPYSLWQQFYHLKYAQYDILDFCRNPEYKAPEWPKEYWPNDPAPANQEEWENIKNKFFKERKEFTELLLDPSNDLFQAFQHGSGQTLFREALLVIEHNAYHTGQILAIMRVLEIY